MNARIATTTRVLPTRITITVPARIAIPIRAVTRTEQWICLYQERRVSMGGGERGELASHENVTVLVCDIVDMLYYARCL